MVNSKEIKTFNKEHVINLAKNEEERYTQVKPLEYLLHLNFRRY